MTEEEKPFQLNEWIFDEYIRYKEQLVELAQRHDDILNRLTEVCRRNDELRAAGIELSTFVGELIQRVQCIPPENIDYEIQLVKDAKKALDRWREANV